MSQELKIKSKHAETNTLLAILSGVLPPLLIQAKIKLILQLKKKYFKDCLIIKK